jgi:hypothetical protein
MHWRNKAPHRSQENSTGSSWDRGGRLMVTVSKGWLLLLLLLPLLLLLLSKAYRRCGCACFRWNCSCCG